MLGWVIWIPSKISDFGQSSTGIDKYPNDCGIPARILILPFVAGG
jgi:hypothetical protein